MTAHKKTLIRQAGSAEAFIDSLPLVVNCFKYSANSAAFQYVLPQNPRIGYLKAEKRRNLANLLAFTNGEVEKRDINGTWIAPLGSETTQNAAISWVYAIGRPAMGHCGSAVLFRRNPPVGRIWSQIGLKHGDSCLGANRT